MPAKQQKITDRTNTGMTNKQENNIINISYTLRVRVLLAL